jgi:hypothetical protein
MYPQFQAELFQNDRTIVIKGGTIDIVSAAERKISQKMRQDYEADISRGVSFFMSRQELNKFELCILFDKSFQ